MTKNISLIILLILFSSAALGQNYGSREGRFEGGFILSYQNSLDESFEGGSSLDIDNSVGWGFGIGWNWTSRLNLSYRFLANRPDYSAVIVPDEMGEGPQTIDHKLSTYSNQFNVTYNFLEGSFTPFVVGGIGWTKVDSNIADGPPVTGCWWDPWWGYVCSTYWNTYSKTEFSYNLGLGFRWDINDSVYSKAAYSREFIDVNGGSLDFDKLTLEVGWMF